MSEQQGQNLSKKRKWLYIAIIFLFLVIIIFSLAPKSAGNIIEEKLLAVQELWREHKEEPKYPPLDKADYDSRIYALAGKKPPALDSTIEVEEGEILPENNKDIVRSPWPVLAEYPKDGAILPFGRIIAYYGNLYSTKMGVLGEYEEEKMLSMLDIEVKKWTEADPNTPAIPALHYIAVVAQNAPGKDGKYRFRMPDSEIEKVLAMAQKRNALVFLDVQAGFSTLPDELPRLEKYLALPNVHLGIDPEFYMNYSGKRPGTVVGTLSGMDVNYASNYLSSIVKKYDLPPKILIVHRFTQRMLSKHFEIKPIPEVQIVVNMDGWGGKSHKINTYKSFIYPEPVQFAGFKIFYKNDTKESGSTVFSPQELLELTPKPIYIQYQ